MSPTANFAGYKKSVEDWGEYFLEKYKEFSCEVCRKKLYWPKYGEGHIEDPVHWDHTKEINMPYQSPYQWLRANTPTDINKIIWESFNFGMVCRQCNLMLGNPIGRIERLITALHYAERKKNENLLRPNGDD